MTKIITFSSSGIYSLPHEDIEVLSNILIINNIEEYEEGIEIRASELNQRAKVVKKMDVKVVFPYINVMTNLIDEQIAKGVTSFLFIVGLIEGEDIIPKINIVKNQYPDIDINIYETKSIGYISAYLAMEAKRLLQTEISFEDLFTSLDLIKNNSNVYFLEKSFLNKYNIYRIEGDRLDKMRKKMKIKKFEEFVRNEINDDSITPFILNFVDDTKFINKLGKLSYFKRAKRYYLSCSVRYSFKYETYGFGYIRKINN